MSPKRLTVAEKIKNFCYCPKGGNSSIGWTIDTGCRFPVCSWCRKPSPQMGLRMCAECRDEFIISFDNLWLAKYVVLRDDIVIEREFFCPPCNGDV